MLFLEKHFPFLTLSLGLIPQPHICRNDFCWKRNLIKAFITFSFSEGLEEQMSPVAHRAGDRWDMKLYSHLFQLQTWEESACWAPGLGPFGHDGIPSN